MFKKIIVMIIVFSMLLIPITVNGLTTPIQHNQSTYSSVYGNAIDVVAVSNESSMTLHYRNLTGTSWESRVMNKKGNVFSGVIPKEITTPPGLVYFFSTAQNKSLDYTIITEYDPISGNPFQIFTRAATGEKIGYDIQYKAGVLPNGKTVNISTQSPTGAFSAISSKLYELRTTGSNPHQGIDFAITSKPVYAASSGKISFVNTEITNAAGMYIKIAHNADGSIPANNASGDLSSHYYHLSSISVNPATGQAWKLNDTVTKGQQIAISGNTGGKTGHDYGYHLDFGFDYFESSTRLPLPLKYFFNTTSWNNGKDLDFAQPARIYFDSAKGTMLEIFVYPKGTNDGAALTLTTYIGADGQVPTKAIPMFKDTSNPQRYYTYLVGSGFDKKYANVYVKIVRDSMSGYVTRPVDKYNAAPSMFYRAYINTGSQTFFAPN